MAKNRIAIFIGSIFLICFLPIFITFAVLYVLGVPMEINDVVMGLADPEYRQFFMVFLLAMGIPSLISSLVVLSGLFAKTQPYAYLSFDEYNERQVYVILRNKHLYIDSDRIITLDKRNNTIVQSRDKQAMKDALRDHLFFLVLEDIPNPKIKLVNSGATLSFKVLVGRTTERRQYRIRYDASGEPKIIKEMISTSAYGNNNIRSLKTLYLESINQNQRIPYDLLIQRQIMMR